MGGGGGGWPQESCIGQQRVICLCARDLMEGGKIERQREIEEREELTAHSQE